MSQSTVSGPGGNKVAGSSDQAVTAVDVVLEPDVAMVERAQAANAALRTNFAKGYSLDDEHRPHISVAGGYFYTARLAEFFCAVNEVLATEKVLDWTMKAFKYYYIPLKEIGLGGIVVEPTASMVRLQKKLIDRVTPFIAPAGDAAAFATTASEPEINQATLDAVASYLAGHTGEHYSPHVTIGVGTAEYLTALVAAPFPEFTFSAVGMSAYQFGNFGTAAKLLHSFKLTQ
jgi:hypothetical protein